MSIHKSPITALSGLGLATGSAVALQPIMPTLSRIAEQTFTAITALKFWNYLLILVAVIVEGPLATILGGVWVAMGRVSFWGIICVAVLAGVLADSFWYFLGYFGREQVIRRWGRFLKVDMDGIAKMEEVLFKGNGRRVLFIAKLTSALIIPALVAAGMTHLGWRRVMRTIIPAQFLWSAGLTMVGFIMADSYLIISQKVENFGWAVGALIGVSFVVYLYYRWRKNGQEFATY